MIRLLLALLLATNTTVYPTDAVTDELLTQRTNDSIIIEYVEGYAVDNENNGIITNTEKDNNYISYRYIDCKPFEPVKTYFVYNPDSTFTDDILYRIDITADGNIFFN